LARFVEAFKNDRGPVGLIKKFAPFFPLILGMYTFCACTCFSGPWLTLQSEEPKKILACLPMEPGEPFHLEFINSIYLAPVRETFVYHPSDGLLIVQVESPSSGVLEYYGLIPEGSQTAHLRRKVGEIRLLSHDYQDHRLRIGSTSLRIQEFVVGGQPLIIRVQQEGKCTPSAPPQLRQGK